MCDEIYYYKDQVKELSSEVARLQKANEFIRKNTLLKVQNKIEYILGERSKSGLPTSGLNYALEAVRSMIKDG